MTVLDIIKHYIISRDISEKSHQISEGFTKGTAEIQYQISESLLKHFSRYLISRVVDILIYRLKIRSKFDI